MHRHGRLTLLLLCLAAAGTACGRADRAAEGAGDSTPAASGDLCTGGAPATVSAGGVGPVRIGARIADIATRCTVRDTTLTLGEESQERARLVALDGMTVVALLAPDSTVTRVIVADGAARTERGIGVGSTLGELRRSYGRLCAAAEERRVTVSVAGMSGVSFATSIDPTRLPGRGRQIDRDPTGLPDSARVTRLWVYDGVSLCGGS
ncbi:MAG TPA: hypothetical protein VNA89_11620 [Gemmatimonadaceae bacterium]|nr:hypothetical protein [Gemmatimonadaceae bacterium]